MGRGVLALLCALICFVVYFANVSLGAARMDVFLGDIAEMLLLFLAALFFVVGVLAREAAAIEQGEDVEDPEPDQAP